MSNIVNEQIKDFFREKREGAYKPKIVYPEGSIIDGVSLISETWLENEAEKKEKEELKNWNEAINNDIF